MKIALSHFKNVGCIGCVPGALQKELDAVKKGTGSAEAKKAIRLKYRVFATCDKPIKNALWQYDLCRAPLCSAHAWVPQEGMHFCPAHKPLVIPK